MQDIWQILLAHQDAIKTTTGIFGIFGGLFGVIMWVRNKALRIRQAELERSGVHLGYMKFQVVALHKEGQRWIHKIRDLISKISFKEVFMGDDLAQEVAHACQHHRGSSPIVRLRTPTLTEHMLRDLVSKAGEKLPDDAVPYVVVMLWETDVADLDHMGGVKIERKFARPTLYSMDVRTQLLRAAGSVGHEAGLDHQSSRSANDALVAQALGAWDPSKPGVSKLLKDRDGYPIAMAVEPALASVQRQGVDGLRLAHAM